MDSMEGKKLDEINENAAAQAEGVTPQEAAAEAAETADTPQAAETAEAEQTAEAAAADAPQPDEAAAPHNAAESMVFTVPVEKIEKSPQQDAGGETAAPPQGEAVSVAGQQAEDSADKTQVLNKTAAPAEGQKEAGEEKTAVLGGIGAPTKKKAPAGEAATRVMKPGEGKKDKTTIFAGLADTIANITKKRPAGRDTATKVADAEGAQPAKKPAARPKSAARTVWMNVLKTLFLVGCGMAIILSVMMVQLSVYVVRATEHDDIDLSRLRTEQQQNSNIVMKDPDNEDDWIVYQELIGNENRIWATLDQIPKELQLAVMAVEDRDFENHKGVSFSRSLYALLNDVFHIVDYSFGGSTIDQQLIKNLTKDDTVLGADGNPLPGYERKIREMYRALVLNTNYTKPQIMEAYLNTMSLSEKIKGVQAGAREYFGKDVSELDLAECALIAGITQKPTAYSPFQNPDGALARRNQVLAEMVKAGYITQEQCEFEQAKPLGVIPQEKTPEGYEVDEIYSYFTDAVIEEVARDMEKQLNYTREEAIHEIYSGGLTIESTVNYALQQIVDRIFMNGFNEGSYFAELINPNNGKTYQEHLGIEVEKTDEDGNVTTEMAYPQIAMSILGYDGSLQAVAGGIGKDRNLGLNRATQSPRQVGSTMKPISAYALGIDMGVITYSTTFRDVGAIYDPTKAEVRDPETDEPVPNWPRNVSGYYSFGYIPVVSGICQSFNTIAVHTGMRVGVENMYDFLTSALQISTLDPVNDMGLAPLVLGALTNGISTYELAAAYQIFGNGGEYNTPHCYERVLDAAGNVILESTVISIQAIHEDSAYIMNRMLWTVLRTNTAPGAYPTAPNMYIRGEMDSIGKTGTTDEDKDRWFCGLTPYFSTAIWWGYDEPARLYWPTGVYNVTINLWKSIMEEIQANMEYKEFPARPSTIESHAYCLETGELAGPGCPATSMGIYSSEKRVPDLCALHNDPGV